MLESPAGMDAAPTLSLVSLRIWRCWSSLPLVEITLQPQDLGDPFSVAMNQITSPALARAIMSSPRWV